MDRIVVLDAQGSTAADSLLDAALPLLLQEQQGLIAALEASQQKDPDIGVRYIVLTRAFAVAISDYRPH